MSDENKLLNQIDEFENENEVFDLKNFTEDVIQNAKDKAKDFMLGLVDIDQQRMLYTIEIGNQVFDGFLKKDVVIVNAPTGFGKSMLGLYVSEIFRNLGGNTYTLTSNKFLQEQYQRDIDHFDLKHLGMLKGMDNYTCSLNNQIISKRECEDSPISNVIYSDDKWVCSDSCVYMQTRKRAMESQNTVFNYSYWLTQMNYVYPNSANPSFMPRDFTIFDEAHTIGNILQQMFENEFDVNTFTKNCIAKTTVIEYSLGKQIMSDIGYYIPLATSLVNLYNDYEVQKTIPFATFDTTFELFYDFIKEIQKIYNDFYAVLNIIVKKCSEKYPELGMKELKKMFSDDENYFIEYVGKISEQYKSLVKICKLLEHLGKSNIVLSMSTSNPKDITPIDEFGQISMMKFKFQCANESGIVRNYVFPWTKYSLFMSASFGEDLDVYAEQIDSLDAVKIVVPQVFDYTKSPIVFVTPMISMTYQNKAQNLDEMVSRVIKIVNSHVGERGLIHTGTFEFMQAIKRRNHPRILTYTNSQEKEEIIELLKKRPDSVVIGPSLIEGVDLKDDLCRFIIWMKVPYLSLGDELVKRKMQLYPNWYGWVTQNNIEQGCGRGHRNMNDWCTNYFLDASFQTFFKRNQAPKYLEDRMIEKHVSDIVTY